MTEMKKRKIVFTKPRRPRVRCRTAKLDGSYVDGYIEMPDEGCSTNTSNQPETSETSQLPPPPPDMPHDTDLASTSAPNTKSRYRKSKERELAKWEEIRDQLLDAATQLAAHTCNVCSFCGNEDSHPIKCEDCGPTVTYCTDCCVRLHLTPAHRPEQWHEAYYKPFVLDNLDTTVLERQDHKGCSSRTLKTFKVFDSAGHLRYWRIYVCSDEEEACTLLRFGLWAASPEQPQTVFSISLLKWLTAMTLECQVSVQGFCNAVRSMSNLSTPEVNTLYKALIGQSVAEFHHYLFRKRSLLHLSAELDDGTLCPLCPTNNGQVIISLDGNFGLVRKKSSGTSSEEPLHGNRYFIPDVAVKKHISTYYEDSTPDNSVDCNSFKAGSLIRSMGRQEKLDVTGVFGAVCRHSMPIKFLNMAHGERLGYPVLMIEELLKSINPGVTVKIMYDIACKLKSHLVKQKKGDLLGQDGLAIPIFHCYGHKASCQVLYSPRRLQGFALTDGECVERLWSFLRRFHAITKEMTPTHRIDLLTDALLHYARRKVTDMPSTLAQSYDKAKKTCDTANEKLTALAVSEEDVERWKEHEAYVITQGNQQRPSSTVSPWKKTYVLHLSEFYSIRQDIQSCPESDESRGAALVSQCRVFERKLGAIEGKHKIHRWQEDSADYQTTLFDIDTEERKRLLENMWMEATERSLLVHLKPKYPVGQKIATKLSEQISSVNLKIRKAVKQYNAIPRSPLDTNLPQKIDFTQVCQPSWDGYIDFDMVEEGTVPRKVKREAIELLCLKRRAEEERRMVPKEMRQFLNTLLEQHRVLMESLKAHIAVTNRGAVAMILDRLVGLEQELQNARSKFSQYVEDLPVVPTLYSEPCNGDILEEPLDELEIEYNEESEAEDDLDENGDDGNDLIDQLLADENALLYQGGSI